MQLVFATIAIFFTLIESGTVEKPDQSSDCKCIIDPRCSCQLDQTNKWSNVECVIPPNGDDRSFPKIYMNNAKICKIHYFNVTSFLPLQIPDFVLKNLTNCAGYGCQIFIAAINMTISDSAFAQFRGNDGDTIAILMMDGNPNFGMINFTGLNVDNLKTGGFPNLNLSQVVRITQLFITDFDSAKSTVIFPKERGKLSGLRLKTDGLLENLTRLPLESLIIESLTPDRPIDNLLPALHSFVPTDFQYIQVSAFTPDIINFPFFEYPQLTHLDLSYNNIHFISPNNIFQKFPTPNFVSLLLSHNLISHIDSNTLVGFHTTDVTNNPLGRLSPGAFNKSTNAYTSFANGASIGLDAFDGVGSTVEITAVNDGKFEIKNVTGLTKSSAGFFLECAPYMDKAACNRLCPTVTAAVCDVFSSVNIDENMCPQIVHLCED